MMPLRFIDAIGKHNRVKVVDAYQHVGTEAAKNSLNIPELKSTCQAYSSKFCKHNTFKPPRRSNSSMRWVCGFVSKYSWSFALQHKMSYVPCTSKVCHESRGALDRSLLGAAGRPTWQAWICETAGRRKNDPERFAVGAME